MHELSCPGMPPSDLYNVYELDHIKTRVLPNMIAKTSVKFHASTAVPDPALQCLLDLIPANSSDKRHWYLLLAFVTVHTSKLWSGRWRGITL